MLKNQSKSTNNTETIEDLAQIMVGGNSKKRPLEQISEADCEESFVMQKINTKRKHDDQP